MDKQLLLVILSSAATALVVAAGLGAFAASTFPGRSRGWMAGALAMAAAVFVAARLAFGAWPSFPPTQAVQWTPWLAVIGAAGLLVTWWLPARRWWARSLITGAAVAGVMIGFTVSRALLRMEPMAARVGCAAAVALSLVLIAWVVGAAFDRAAGSSEDGASALARLRDRHWPTLSLGLVLAAGAPAMLFAAHFKKVMDLGVVLACGLGGVALIGWLIHRRMNLAGAGVVAVLVYVGLWWVALFYGGSDVPPVLGLVLGLSAPLGLIIGTGGPLARRGGWARLLVTVGVSVGPVAAALAVYGPAYLQELREMQP